MVETTGAETDRVQVSPAVPIDHYIVDFACLSERLIVEVEGGTHSTDQEVARDVRRERYLEECS